MQVTDTNQSIKIATVSPEALATAAEKVRALVANAVANTTVPLSEIGVGRNPRTHFDPIEMAQLTESVRNNGVIQPILVRVVDGKYKIIAGERRFRAASAAHGDSYRIPVMVIECTDEEADVLASVENIQRADMSAIEEACAAAKIVGDVQGDRAEAARLLSWSPQKLDSRLGLMNCSESVRDALKTRVIKLGHAELLATLAKHQQDKLLPVIISEKKTVDEIRKTIEQVAAKLAAAIFDKADCNGCPHNSEMQASMFEESISDGCCTNPTCYKQKTEAQLVSISDSLKDEYPVIRIIRTGDNSTLTKLVATGASGVGEDQALACRSCKDFGAAVSGLPQGLGAVYKDQCFNTGCNANMVAARIKTDKEAAAAKAADAAGEKAAGASGSKSPAPKTPEPAKATKVNESDRVKAYREKVWRSAMKTEIVRNRELSIQYLLALCLNGNAGKIDSSALGNAFAKWTDQKKGFDLGAVAAQVASMDEKVSSRMMTMLAASAMESLDVRQLQSLAKHHKLDLRTHWKLDKEFLDLLTKSEIEVLAKSIKLDEKIGEGFKKLFAEKKDDLIKKLLTVEGFDYSATIPPVINY